MVREGRVRGHEALGAQQRADVLEEGPVLHRHPDLAMRAEAHQPAHARVRPVPRGHHEDRPEALLEEDLLVQGAGRLLPTPHVPREYRLCGLVSSCYVSYVVVIDYVCCVLCM